MHVRNERRHLLLQPVEARLERIEALGVAIVVAIVRIVVGARILAVCVLLLVLRVGVRGRGVLVRTVLQVLRDEAVDVFLSIADAAR